MALFASSAVLRMQAVSAGLVASFLIATPALSQTFPTKPVRIVVPAAAGGNADIVARTIGAGMSRGLGQAVVIDNRPGGRQIPASLAVAKSAPDGYTLLAVGLSFTVNAGLYDDLPFDSLNDFSPVGLVGSAPLLLVAHPGLLANSMKELIALAKAKPGTLNYGSAGLGSPAHLGGELLNTLADIKLVNVSYKATAQANNDAISGVVQLGFPATSSVVSLVKSGKLKALGIGSPKRSPLLPDVPPIGDTVPGYDVQLWNGLVAPAHTPGPIVARLNADMNKALATPDIAQKFDGLGLDLDAKTPAEFKTYMDTEIKKWARVVKQAGIKGER
jgi:tripartite-type tricarboxylate transporter receptor subunit TctC